MSSQSSQSFFIREVDFLGEAGYRRAAMHDLDAEQLREALQDLGDLLTSRGQHYELVLVGGGNLMLRGLIRRATTKDLDLLGEWSAGVVQPLHPVPSELQRAIRDVALTLGLVPDWINLGPASLMDLGLPAGFAERLERFAYGEGLGVWLASRYDMVCFKLYAAVDQGTRSHHFQDLQELQPGRDELLSAAQWTMSHDISAAYRDLLVAILEQMGVEHADTALG